MDITVIILAGVAVAALGILVLKLGKRLAIGGLAAVVTTAWALLEQARATRQAAEAATVAAAGQAAMSAATSVTLFLVAVILGLAGLAVGVVLLSCWLRQRQKRARLGDALQQAQIYALLQGARPAAPRRPATPAQGGGDIVIVPGQQQAPSPGLTLDDLARAIEEARGRPDLLTGLLPPDDGGWKVL